MAKKLSTHAVGLFIGLAVAALIVFLSFIVYEGVSIPERIELRVLDFHFRFQSARREREYLQRATQVGATTQAQDPGVSEDVIILAVDTLSLSRFGRWPWPRYRHADLVNTLARLSDQGSRESSLFLDFFFIEPSANAYSDAVLVDAIRQSGRVYLETVLANETPPPEIIDEFFERHEVLFRNAGQVSNVRGEWWAMRPHFGLEPPLQPFGRVTAGYGHANFTPDPDTVFRRQPLVARISRLVEELRLDELSPRTPVDVEGYEWLGWTDRDRTTWLVEYPLTDRVIEDLTRELRRHAPLRQPPESDPQGEPYYVVHRYRDQFIPSITLSLSLDYFGRAFDDLEVVVGSHIRIPDVRVYDPRAREWGEYQVPLRFPEYDAERTLVREGRYRPVRDVVIPINEHGEMLINWAGPRSSAARDGYQTFPVRSYAAYAGRVPGIDESAWPSTLALENKIVMVGPFASGMADDEKLTPHGLMYGVEMHANALNTIIMDRFLHHAPRWMDIAVLVALALIVAFVASRLQPVISLAISVVMIVGYFVAVSALFANSRFILNYSSPALAMILTFIGVVVYRVVTEGAEKRFIKKTFAMYVSPDYVDQLVDTPEVLEELGGVERELTMYFSDIQEFTKLSEALEPRRLADFLNRYLTELVAIIQDERGTIDKFVGDAIVAFWNWPQPDDQHALHGVQAALRCQKRIAELEQEFMKPIEEGGVGRHGRTRIGLNTQLTNVGNFGSEQRLTITAIGDGMNLASRLEGANKYLGTFTLVSESTYRQLGGALPARRIGSVEVVGKIHPITVYEPMLPETYEAGRRTYQTYERALEAAEALRLDEARTLLGSIVETDLPARKLLAELTPQWTGVRRLTEK